AIGNDTVVASAAGVQGTVVFQETTTVGGAASIFVVSGNSQIAQVTSQLPLPLVAQVNDQYGNPVSGATVSVASTFGSLPLGTYATPTNFTTGANGQVAVPFTFGVQAGLYTVAMTTAGATNPANFSETATAAPGTGLVEYIAGSSPLATFLPPVAGDVGVGDQQTGIVGTVLPTPIVVQAQDGHGVPGIVVTFAVVLGDATVSAPSVVTDSNGNAQTVVTLGSAPGPVAVQVSSLGLNTLSFSETAQLPSSSNYQLSIAGGN